MIAARGKYICEILSRHRKLPSGIYLADKINGEKKDNVGQVIAIGAPGIKTCTKCQDKMWCRRKCAKKGKTLEIIGKIGNIFHFRGAFSVKIKYQDKSLAVITADDIIAIEDSGSGDIQAVGSLVVVSREYAEKDGKIYIPDNAKQNSGDFWGNVVSVGPEYPDKSLKIGDRIIYDRGEGYRFKAYGSGEEYFSVKERWIYGREDK